MITAGRARRGAGRVLALDPSSTCTGYALIGFDGHIIDAGRIRPHRDKDANHRITAVATEVIDLFTTSRPDIVVMEDTSGKVSGRHKGHGAGLSVYGKAIGYLWGRLAAVGAVVEMVPENEWTGGRRKSARAAGVKLAHGRTLDLSADTGHDAADAVALGEWWIARQRFAEASRGPVG